MVTMMGEESREWEATTMSPLDNGGAGGEGE
jgi:hypothetical protein